MTEAGNSFVEVCNSWEEIVDNSSVLDKQLERLKLEKARERGQFDDEHKFKLLTRKGEDKNTGKVNPPSIELDSTREESLRSQYAPPEPKISILTRPKNTQKTNGHSSKSKAQSAKTLEQREKEYAEARKRILGDVQFDEPEEDMSAPRDANGVVLSPAEILKQKVAQAMKPEDDGGDADGVSDEGKTSSGSGGDTQAQAPPQKTKSRGKKSKSREKFKTSNPESPRDFPLSKSESERIVRQPRGPDGTTGFQLQR